MHEHARVAGAYQACGRVDVLDGADLVVGQHQRDQHSVVAHRCGHALRVDAAVGFALHDRDVGLTPLTERQRGAENGLVLDGADHEVAAPLGSPALHHSAHREVVGLGAAAGECQLAWGAAENGGDAVTGVVHGLACIAAPTVR